MYGEGAVTDQKCRKWFVKFHAGDFSLDDAPRLSRLLEVDRHETETLRTIDLTPHGHTGDSGHAQNAPSED